MSHVNETNPALRSATPVLECPTGRWWICAMLGVVLLIGGVFVLFNVVLASMVSAIFFASAMIVGGGFQIVHAFSARGWGSLALSLVIGILFVLGGLLMLSNPLATSIGLTLGIAALLFASGVVRVMLAFRHWRDYGWLLLASGVLGIVLGIVLIAGYPWSGLVVPGMLLGFDLIMHGGWWLALGFLVRRPRGGAAGTPESVAVPS